MRLCQPVTFRPRWNLRRSNRSTLSSSSRSSIKVLKGDSASVVKDKGIGSTELVGSNVGGVGSNDAHVTQTCLDVDMFSEEMPTPLRFCPVVAKQERPRTMPFSLGFAGSEGNSSFYGAFVRGF